MDPALNDRPRSQTVRVATVDLAASRTARQRDDEVIVEEPLTVRFDGVTVMTTMRTPGHDYELAVGWCHSEGLLDRVGLRGVRHCDLDELPPGTDIASAANTVAVESDAAESDLTVRPVARLTLATSSCGICGTEALDQIGNRLSPLAGAPPLAAEILVEVCRRAIDHQGLFARTGGVHAAAAFTAQGEIILSREDVGRHNAVDKIVGRLRLDGVLPATGLGLFVSGRASFELVYKAWAAGFSTMVSISAPTSLAVDAARRAGLHLAGFVRGARFNVYAPEPGSPSLGP